MRIPQDETKTVTSVDATVATRLDAVSSNGSRKLRVLNRTGQDLYIWVTDNVTVPDDNSVLNSTVKSNAIIIVPNNVMIEEDNDDSLKMFGAVMASTGAVRVQEKTN